MADGDDDEALKARLEKLGAELKSARRIPPTSAPLAPSDGSTGAAWSMGIQAGSEFIAGVVIGGAIGWGIDRWLHTKPIFTILFFLLGSAAGILGVIRATKPKERE